MNPLLSFAEDRLQIVALLFMAAVYALKIRWILKFPQGRDRQPGSGDPRTNGPKGARYSLLNIAMPWSMASTRRHPFFYVQFVIFHVGVATSILMSFLIPYVPRLVANPLAILAMQAIFGAAFLVGVARMVRRLSDVYIKSISSPDDYFSLALLIVWLAFSFLAAPNRNESVLLGYFFLTAFFLVYVPFSKISHYIYYPFARWYLGRTLGHRGVYPLRKGAAA
jgi:membrane protein CcdC involved in cytochrome C biogenesis